MIVTIRDPYAILCISANAPVAEVKSAYRFWAFALHPDRFAARSDLVPTAQAILKRVNGAKDAIEGGRAVESSEAVDLSPRGRDQDALWVGRQPDSRRLKKAICFWRFALSPERFTARDQLERAARGLRRVEQAYARLSVA